MELTIPPPQAEYEITWEEKIDEDDIMGSRVEWDSSLYKHKDTRQLIIHPEFSLSSGPVKYVNAPLLVNPEPLMRRRSLIQINPIFMVKSFVIMVHDIFNYTIDIPINLPIKETYKYVEYKKSIDDLTLCEGPAYRCRLANGEDIGLKNTSANVRKMMNLTADGFVYVDVLGIDKRGRLRINLYVVDSGAGKKINILNLI